MYPILFQAEPELEGRNRLTTFFRYFTAIPIMIVAFLYAIGVYLAVFVAWFAIVFTGRYPAGIYNFVASGLRLFTRANGYYYLLTDKYPPFNGEPDDSYPIRLQIAPPQESYNRLSTFFRVLLLIPVYIVAWLYSVGLAVVTLIAWFSILFTGRYPEGVFNFARNASAYVARAGGYWMLITDKFPPVSEEPQVAPAAMA